MSKINPKSILAALDRSQAVISFTPDGIVLEANENFLNAVGYEENEIIGQHHSMFVTKEDRKSEEYKKLWEDLRAGRFRFGEIKRIGKDGKELWLQACYNPVIGKGGNVTHVIKFATDITKVKNDALSCVAQVNAINRSQAVIEFSLDGTILTANNNFLSAVGYALHEVAGKHHSMFVKPSYAASPEYKDFWRELSEGSFKSGKFQRFGKNGREIWIEATYNPIFDDNGNPVKIIKFASDITEERMESADLKGQIEAINKSQAVIEFDLLGNILDANKNFLDAMGYTLEEVRGKHHKIFVDPKEVASPQYRQFWEKLRDGKFHAGRYERYDKHGNSVWIEATYNPIFDFSAEPFKVVKFATNITEQVCQERENSVLSVVANQATSSVVIADKNNQIDYVNPGFVRLTGYTLEEVKGRNLGMLLRGEQTDPEVAEIMAAKIAAKEPFYQEVLSYSKDGMPHWTSLAIDPIYSNTGVHEGFIYLLADITSTKLEAINSSVRIRAIEQSNVKIEWGRNKRVKALNDTAMHVLKCDSFAEAASLECLNFSSVFTAEDQQHLMDKQPLSKTITITLPNSEIVTLSASVQPLYDIYGAIDSIVMYALDMSANASAIAQLTGVLDQIDAISRKISGVSGQTNLLSLNAKIEAERAGEAGLGFGVVATEVKELAASSAALNTEISTIVRRTNEEINALRLA